MLSLRTPSLVTGNGKARPSPERPAGGRRLPASRRKIPLALTGGIFSSRLTHPVTDEDPFGPDSPYTGWDHYLIEYKHPRTGTRHLRASECQSTACGKPVDRLEKLEVIDPQETPWLHPLNCTKCQRALERGELGYVISLEAPLRTRTGRILTEDDIQRLAEEAELGYDVEHLLPRPPRPRTAREMGAQPIDIWPDAYDYHAPKDRLDDSPHRP